MNEWVMILSIVVGLLSLADKILEMVSGKSSVKYLRSKIQKNVMKINESIKSLKTDGSIMSGDNNESKYVGIVEDLIDLSELVLTVVKK